MTFYFKAYEMLDMFTWLQTYCESPHKDKLHFSEKYFYTVFIKAPMDLVLGTLSS